MVRSRTSCNPPFHTAERDDDDNDYYTRDRNRVYNANDAVVRCALRSPPTAERVTIVTVSYIYRLRSNYVNLIYDLIVSAIVSSQSSVQNDLFYYNLFIRN